MAMMQKYQESLPAVYDTPDSEPLPGPQEPEEAFHRASLRHKQSGQSLRSINRPLSSESHGKSQVKQQGSFKPANGTTKRGIGPSVTPEPKRRKRISPEIGRELSPEIKQEEDDVFRIEPQPEYEPLVDSPFEIEEDSPITDQEDVGDEEIQEAEQVMDPPPKGLGILEKFKMGEPLLLRHEDMKILDDRARQRGGCIIPPG
ncbi:hypothetical protein ABW21_db0207372 [Orbilia brochopaga]|nr:hypothetical protein ABW21_db0207372 [Drechslerella brochopaga]